MKKAWLLLALLAASAAACGKDKIVGVARDSEDSTPIIFATEPAWPECKGGSAYKEAMPVACWVVIDDENVIFVMWPDGRILNIDATHLRPCSNALTCKLAVVE